MQHGIDHLVKSSGALVNVILLPFTGPLSLPVLFMAVYSKQNRFQTFPVRPVHLVHVNSVFNMDRHFTYMYVCASHAQQCLVGSKGGQPGLHETRS